MLKTTIKVRVKDQTLTILNSPRVTSGGVNENEIKFMFDESWDGLKKTAVFYSMANPDRAYEIPISDDQVVVPALATARHGILRFAVYGTDTTEKKTSNIVEFNIFEGPESYTIIDDGDVPVIPSGGFSGDYNDLYNKPVIPSKTSDLTNDSEFITLSDIPEGFSGDYNDLQNKPSIPSKTSELNNDSGFITSEDIPEGFSGDYNDLQNKPSIPSKTSELNNDSGFITSEDIPKKLSDLQNDLHFLTLADLPIYNGGVE